LTPTQVLIAQQLAENYDLTEPLPDHLSALLCKLARVQPEARRQGRWFTTQPGDSAFHRYAGGGMQTLEPGGPQCVVTPGARRLSTGRNRDDGRRRFCRFLAATTTHRYA